MIKCDCLLPGCPHCKPGQKMESLMEKKVRWWLAEICPLYGYAQKLVDGPHENFTGVQQAAYLIEALGLKGNRQFCCVRVEETPVIPIAHDVNQEDLATLKKTLDRGRKKEG